MEKNNFRDRPIESTFFSQINIGDNVYICEKQMQQTATCLEDLTLGTVLQKLTRRNHPRGIKVEILTKDNRKVVGRCVYLFRNGKILRKGE